MGRAASLNTRQKAVKPLSKTSAEQNNDASKSRSASVSRNSIGKYIGASKEHSVSMAALPNPLFERIEGIENNVQNLEGEVQNLNQTKQDKVTDAQPGNIAIWDDAGQTSDSGKSVTEDAVSDASTHDTIPTSQAVYDYVNAQNYVDSDTLTQTLTDYVTTDAITDAVNSAAQTVVDGLAPVAISGSYNDLTDRPELAAVATSGAYSDLTGTPTLAPVATSGAYSDLTGTPTLAPVAISGSYNDLSNVPQNLVTNNQITEIMQTANSALNTANIANTAASTAQTTAQNALDTANSAATDASAALAAIQALSARIDNIVTLNSLTE